MLHILRRGQQLEELHDVRTPVRGAACEFLQHSNRPLAPPKPDRIRHFGPASNSERIDRTGGSTCFRTRTNIVQAVVAYQVPDVGYEPPGARLNELVIVELSQVLLADLYLFGDDREQRL